MSKIKPANTNQLFLVPSNPGCLLPVDHLVRIFDQMAEEEIDFSPFARVNRAEKHGRPSYDPAMLAKVVLYGYMQGITSSRDLERSCVDRIDFRFLTSGLTPSFSTFTKFRSEHAEALAALFPQSVMIAATDELIEMADVAFDGTKILANASKHKAMSYQRMCEVAEKIHNEIQVLKKERPQAKAKRKEEIETELKFKRERFAKIQEEKFALEDEHVSLTGELPNAKAQRNFTDPDSRIMKKGAGFEQCYNAQAAVDKRNQIILAAYVTQAGNDKNQMEPLVESAIAQVGVLPDRGMADAGYFSEAVVTSLKKRFATTEWLISPGRLAHGSISSGPPRGRIPADISVADLMRRKLSTKAGKLAYAQRKAIVEPAFGQIKEANLEFRQFSFRGLRKVRFEWQFVCAAHNLLKVVRQRQKDRRPCIETAARQAA
jgi:transposase